MGELVTASEMDAVSALGTRVRDFCWYVLTGSGAEGMGGDGMAMC